MQKWNYNIIGTHLALALDTEVDCSDIFHDIETRLQNFEKKFSRFIEGNWLYELNMNRRGTLDDDGMKMLSYALDIARKTDGYFDPTVGRRLTELGYGRQGIMKNEQGIVLEKGYGDYRDIEMKGDEVILHGDILLEFGGVGKGYLIDVIRDIIDRSLRHAEEGIIRDSSTQSMDSSYRQDDGKKVNIRYLINFGGDMYGCGEWKVGLESPFAPDEVIGTYMLDDEFFACSAGTRRKWAGHHHLIDPHTGESAREVVASYIEGSSGISVDSYATALCVMPWERAIDTLKKTPEISGVIVRYDGTLFQKEGSRSVVFT